jgi:biopolymer transport protein TolR
MTRGQVRAACRRMRDHVEEIEEEAGELNLVPYMDIVTNIIIFLLASMINQVSLANVNVSVPSISGGAASADQPDVPEKPPLNLTVSVGASGFTVAASGGVLPIMPKLPNGQYDYKSLTAKLKEIKSAPDNAETKANFSADANIPYDTVIATLDAMRLADDGKILFPDISFAAGIL